MSTRDDRALLEILRLCELGAHLVARGSGWYRGDPDNVPGLAAEAVIVKIGENVARLTPAFISEHPQVPWSPIKKMRDCLVHHYDSTDYGAVWDTLVSDLPQIRTYVAPLIHPG